MCFRKAQDCVEPYVECVEIVAGSVELFHTPCHTPFVWAIYFISSGQGQGLPVALEVGRCASTFLR